MNLVKFLSRPLSLLSPTFNALDRSCISPSLSSTLIYNVNPLTSPLLASCCRCAQHEQVGKRRGVHANPTLSSRTSLPIAATMTCSSNAFQTLGLATADERHYFNRQLLAVGRDLTACDYERNVEFWPKVERRTRMSAATTLLTLLLARIIYQKKRPKRSAKKEGSGGNQKKDNDGDGGSGRGKDGNGLVGMGSGLKA